MVDLFPLSLRHSGHEALLPSLPSELASGVILPSFQSRNLTAQT